MKKRKIRKVLVGICIIVVLINVKTLFGRGKIWQYQVEAKTAKPIIVIERDNHLKTQIKENSFPIEYYFCINNYQDEEINEVEFEYNIELESSTENFPVSYQLVDLKNNQEIRLIDGKSENLKIGKDTKESRKFKIVFQWQELNKELADEFQLKLKVNIVQKQEENNEN